MTNMNINATQVGNAGDGAVLYTIDSKATDGVNSGSSTETYWQNYNWTKQWGYFNAVPDLKSALLMKAVWLCGKGYTANPDTIVQLDRITGWGKDTFDDILFNLVVTARIAGDAYAEIIWEKKEGSKPKLLNLKPLDPSTIRIVLNPKGIIIRYEQMAKTGTKKAEVTFEPSDILHISHNRLVDSIHGLSDIDALEKTILADEQSFDDVTKAMHTAAQPMILWKVGSDDPTTVTNFKANIELARSKGNANIYVPNDVNTVDWEVVQLNPAAMILEWRSETRNRFFRSIGLPQIVPGAGGQSTESESKVIYLAFEQIVEKEQRQLEKQLWQQLYIEIDLVPPTTISDNLQEDASKDGAAGLMPQPSDTTAGSGR